MQYIEFIIFNILHTEVLGYERTVKKMIMAVVKSILRSE